MHRKHQAYWSPKEVQQFWSGRLFHRPGEGQTLAYDLARIMVEQMGLDWPAFRSFATAAKREDSGAAAALAYLGVELGAYVTALLEATPSEEWNPDPAFWNSGDDSEDVGEIEDSPADVDNGESADAR